MQQSATGRTASYGGLSVAFLSARAGYLGPSVRPLSAGGAAATPRGHATPWALSWMPGPLSAPGQLGGTAATPGGHATPWALSWDALASVRPLGSLGRCCHIPSSGTRQRFPRWWGENLTWMDACGLRHPGSIFSRPGGGAASLRLAACGHACARVYACAPKRAARCPRLAP